MGLLPAEVTMVSVVLVSSSRIVGYVGCNRKSLLISGSAAETPGATWLKFTQHCHKCLKKKNVVHDIPQQQNPGALLFFFKGPEGMINSPVIPRKQPI